MGIGNLEDGKSGWELGTGNLKERNKWQAIPSLNMILILKTFSLKSRVGWGSENFKILGLCLAFVQ